MILHQILTKHESQQDRCKKNQWQGMPMNAIIAKKVETDQYISVYPYILIAITQFIGGIAHV